MDNKHKNKEDQALALSALNVVHDFAKHYFYAYYESIQREPRYSELDNLGTLFEQIERYIKEH